MGVHSAYGEGRAAYRRGVPQEAAPYASNALIQAWEDGWLSAHEEAVAAELRLTTRLVVGR